MKESPSEPVSINSQKPNEDNLFIAGIGASAGGIAALMKFFEHVPVKTGIAYVVILHLSPDHDSKLAEVLQVACLLPVIKVTARMKVVADHVYVIPPDQHLFMVDGDISVSGNVEIEDRRAPVDIFFRTLAERYGPRAICVVLSGTGANGSMGMKRVKESGGAAYVQNPKEAEFNEMPRNAIATGLVDAILPVAEIPARIMAYTHGVQLSTIPIEPEKRPEDLQHALREIFTQLKIRTGHDFTNYKRATLLRRIERRINVHNFPDISTYAEYSQEHPEESIALLKDLLISVTNFFRDKRAFEAIEQEIIPELIRGKTSQQQVRVWVAGCATGEEAYSLAILFAERTMNVLDAPKIQIFATDIDDAAISHAREGLYTINDAADVSAERLRSFFTKEGEQYRIRREVREMILFANHNFLKDPPFFNLDMVSCRNVLIYLNSLAQERVMEIFHFALNPSGFMFLGSSESADSANDLYAAAQREHHIFQKRAIKNARYPIPESLPSFKTHRSDKASVIHEPSIVRNEQLTYGDLHQRLLEQYAPPSVIINEDHDILHLSEHAGRYLQIAGGELSNNLLKLVRPELRLELRSALYQAVQRKTAVEARGLLVTVDDHVETLTVHVRPVLHGNDIARDVLLVLFEREVDAGSNVNTVLSSDEPVALQLEKELIRLKGQLRVSSEQYEFQAEELRATNEELQAMNEELRSSAEELETSKEELQSINEELRTVNQELKIKVEETTLAGNNLHNLINSVDIGTIFLDRNFRVAFFTPSARELFNLIPTDYGRPLSDITCKLNYNNIMEDAVQVLSKLQALEREVNADDGRVFIMRVVPYRTSEDRINGVVLTFVEISSLKRTEAALRTSEQHLRLLIESAKDYAIFSFDNDQHVTTWNNGAEAMMGYVESEIVGQPGDILFVPEDRMKGSPQREIETAREQGVAANERWHLRKDGSRFYGSGTVRSIYDNAGVLIGFVKIMRDLTASKQAEEKLRESEESLRITLESVEMGVWDWNIVNNRVKWNAQHFIMLGLKAQVEEVDANYFMSFIHRDDLEQVDGMLKSAIEQASIFQLEFRIVKQDTKEVRWMSGYGRAISKTMEGTASRMVGVMYDVTKRKKLEQQKDEFIAVASHELKTPITSIKGYAEILQDRFQRANDAENKLLMEKLNGRINHVITLIQDLLDTSKIVEGNLPLELASVDLNFLLRDYVSELPEGVTKNRIILHEGIVRSITADRERLRQVFSNLVSNALIYSPDTRKVVIRTAAIDNGVQVTIQDFGIGIAKDMRERIFDRFFRVPPSHGHTPQSGMGLGLYISAGIIERHGGTITLESKENEGTTFRVTLPYTTKVS